MYVCMYLMILENVTYLAKLISSICQMNANKLNTRKSAMLSDLTILANVKNLKILFVKLPNQCE